MIVAFSLLSPRAFPTVNNFTNVLNQASLAMIIAGGLTLAVIVGELDLSIGFAASLHGMLVTGLIVARQAADPAGDPDRARRRRADRPRQRPDRHQGAGSIR